MIYPQLLLDIHDELLVDLFAGGGGASCGIEMATGRQVDIAVNHDEAAIGMHEINHPQTEHHHCDVFEVCPKVVTKGRPIGLLWASPDCTYHSKARGGKPIRDKRRRALAWVVTRWAGQVRPRVIMLENVEEFIDWGPLVGPPDALRPDPTRRGKTFRRWVRSLERHGYHVEWRELRACDYGAPTIRKRLFVIARCDGQPIVWPASTHGKGKKLKPYRTAAECIDWSLPMPSIFLTKEEAKEWGQAHGQQPPKRPLAEATMKRIARGVKRYVLDNPRPFILSLQHGGRTRDSSDPLHTVTASRKDCNMLVAPSMVHIGNGERKGQKPRALDIEAPLNTIVASPKHALVAAFLAQNNAGFYEGAGRSLDEPARTVLSSGSHQSLVAAHIQRDFGQSVGHAASEPLGTVTGNGGGKAAIVAAHLTHSYTSNTRGGDGDLTHALKTIVAGGQHHGLVAAFMQKYYGTNVGHRADEPAHTISTVDRFGLVTVQVDGQPFVISDIALRMLQPRELYRAQGFPDSYVIDRGADGRRLTKTEQVRMVGNSVPPQFAMALVRANIPQLIARKEAA